MNEEEFLLKYNLKYNEIGALTTLNDVYVSEFSNEEGSVKSHVSKADFDLNNKQQGEVIKSGYEFDETSDYGEYDQKKQSVAKAKLNTYLQDPSFTTLSELPENGSKDPNYQVAFDGIMKEKQKKGEDYFSSFEAMEQNISRTRQQDIEDNVVLSSLETDEERKSYIANQANLKKLEKEHGKDDKTLIKEAAEIEDLAIGPNGIPMMRPDEDANIIEKGMFSVMKGFSDAKSWALAGMTSAGEGIEDEKAKAEYLRLKDEEHVLIAPIATKKKMELQAKMDLLEKQAEDVGYWSRDYAMLNRQHQQMGKKIMELDNFVNKAQFDWSIFSSKTITDIASLGFTDVHEQLLIDLAISKKMENKEELSDLEKGYLETQHTLKDIDGLPLEQSFMHQVTGGTVQSFSFLLGGIGGRAAGKVISRGITTKLAKLSTPLVKTLAVSANVGTQTLLHSNTYNESLKQYVGDVEITEDAEGQPVFLARHDLYNSIKEENRLKLVGLDRAIFQNEGNAKVVAELEASKKSLTAYDNSVKMPMSGAKSLLYGGFETLKEVGSEQFGGAILGKLGSGAKGSIAWMGKKANIGPNKLSIGLEKARRKFSSLDSNALNDFNRMATAVPGKKLIGGQGEEMFEEVLVQVIPTVGSDWQDYKNQLSELTKADFYVKIAAQTFLMRSGMKGVSSAKQKYDTFTKLSSKDRATAKKAQEEMEVLFKTMGKKGGTQADFNKAFMQIGEGKFSITDYNNAIQGLQESGNFEEVSTQEEMKRDFAQKQIQAVQAQGKLKEFKKALNKAKYNKNLDAGTKGHMAFLSQEINEIEGDDATYVNSTQVINLKSKKKYTDRALAKLETSALNQDINESEALDEINKKLNTKDKTVKEIFKGDLKFSLGNIAGMSNNAQEYLALEQQRHSMTEASNELQKEIERVTDFKHQNVLMNEQDYSAYIARVNKKVFKGEITADQFQKYIADQPRSDFKKNLTPESLSKINSAIHEELVSNETAVRKYSAFQKQMEARAKEKAAAEKAAASFKKGGDDVTKPDAETIKAQGQETVAETATPLTEEVVAKSVETPKAKTTAEQQEYHQVNSDNIFGALNAVAEATSVLPETNVTSETRKDKLVQSKQGAIEQAKLEQVVTDLKAEKVALRDKDGTISDENMKRFKSIQKLISKATKKATRADTSNGVFHAIKTKSPVDGDPVVLTQSDAIKAEQDIQEIITNGLKNKKDSNDILSEITSKYSFDISTVSSILNYIEDQDSSVPEVGNNKQSFAAWRKASYDNKRVEEDTDDTEDLDEDGYIEMMLPGGTYLNDKTTATLKAYYEDKIKWEGVSPTFQDFWLEAIQEGFIAKNDLSKEQIKMLGLNWQQAGNGKSNWESIWDKNYVKPNSFLSQVFEENGSLVKTEEEVIAEIEEASEAAVIKAEPQQVINPTTGAVVPVTSVAGKTSVVTAKANFKAIAYQNETSDVQTVNGKKVIQVSKQDTNQGVPMLAESKTINIVATLNSNPGDIWSVAMATEAEWDIPVEVTNTANWTTEFMPFSTWVKRNIKGRSIEDFQNSPEYINKVPMLYRNNKQQVVGVVADSDWYSPLTIKDSSKKNGEFVELNNPTAAHAKSIKEGKDNTIALRQKIASGEVTNMEVETRDGSPYAKVPRNLPAVSLEKASPTSEIVFFKTGNFYGLNNEKINEDKTKAITNPGLIKKLNQQNNSGNNSAYYMSPVYIKDGVQFYEVIAVLRKNENNENSAFDADIQTSKYILGAQKVLKFPDANQQELGITKTEALALQALVKAQTGLDIQDYGVAKELVHGLIAIQGLNSDAKDSKFTVSSKNVPIMYQDKNGNLDTKEVSFTDALFLGQSTVVQNTYVNSNNSKGITISKNSEGSFDVNVAETYEKFLRKRLFTDVVSYDIGTEGNPKFTHSVQPIIKLKTTTAVSVTVAPQVKNEVKPTIAVAKETLTEEQNEQVLAAQNALRLLNALNEGSISEDYIGDLKNISNVKKALNLVSTFLPKQQRELGGYMFSLIANNSTEANNLNNTEFKQLIERLYKDNFRAKKAEITAQYNIIKSIADSGNSSEAIQELLKNLVATVDNLDMVINNFDQIYLKKIREAGKKKFIDTNVKSAKDLEKELDKEASQAEQGYVKDYNQSSNEVVHKDKISKKLKKIFSEVSTGETGFMGIDLYQNYDKVYNKIASFMSNPLPLSPNFDTMIAKLETIPEFASIVASLKESDVDVQNGFVSNMYKYAANAKFIAFTTNGQTGLEGEVWFSNRNNLKQKIRETWDNNFKRSDVVTQDSLNQEKLQKLADQYDSWKGEGFNQDPEVLKEWLRSFGLDISEGTWDELVEGNLMINRTGLSNEKLSFEDLFYDEGKRRDRLFSSLANYAKTYAKTSSAIDFTKNDKLVPFEDMNNIMKGLIEIESHHNASLANITRRDGGKTVSEIVFPSHFLDTFNALSNSAGTDKAGIKALQETAYAENSYWLDLLMNEPAMADVFSYGETGLMSMRNMDKPMNDYSKIENLSSLDYMYHQRAMFQFMRTEPFPRYKGFKMRVATMSIPTSSDKGRMMLLKVPVFDLLAMENTLTANDNGTVNFSQDLNDLLFEQLVKPELNRIVEHKLLETEPDIKNYNKGAVRFNAMAGLNTLKNSEGVSAVKFLEQGGSIKDFTSQYKDAAVAHIKELMENDVVQNLSVIGDTNQNSDNFNKKEYISRNTATTNQKKKLAEFDYVINSYFNNTNIMQTMAGDPAIYFNSKGSDSTIDDKALQAQYSKELGVNMGKRLALMIAPGIVTANSDTQKHIQLFLKDQSEVASMAENIVEFHYGKDALKEEFMGKTYDQHIKDLRDKKSTDVVKEQLNLKFAKVAKFFDIESTDAQEYTTLREHLRLLVGEGKITQDKADEIHDHVFVKKLPLDRNDKDVQLVLQPMKPVYTGSVIKDGINRIMYIKSSSFPLIPDLITGTGLEPLMNKMNEIQELSGGKTVRASYQSANKVGAMATEIDPFSQNDLDGLTTNWNSTDLHPTDSMVLNGMGLKIQQDIPFKSAVKGDDKVSMGTQIFKLLFGDGVADINTDDFDGASLQEEFFEAFSVMIDISKQNLLDKLGLDENYKPIDKAESFEKLSELLKESAEERDFSDNDLKLLDVNESTKRDGSKVNHFTLPLWFSGNSNKFESMLTAIVNNKIFKQKLPGNSFVVGSEAGLTIRTQEDLFQETEEVVEEVVVPQKAQPVATDLTAEQKAEAKPELSMSFVSRSELTNSEDIDKTLEDNNRIKDEYTELEDLMGCLWQ